MKKLPNTLDKVSIFILLDYQNYGLTIMEVAEEINRRIINGSVPAETLVMQKIAEENIKFTFTGKSGMTILAIVCDILKTKKKILTDSNIVNELKQINGGYFENEFAQENLTSYIKSNFTA